MGSDPRKRQKKLERKAAKRKEKKYLLVREQNAGLAERMTAAAKFPILHCWIGNSLADEGMGWVLLSREIPNARVAAVSFLVDRYCLGVKNVHAEVLPRPAYDDKYFREKTTRLPSHNASPAEARKLLEEAVAYARGLGLTPHADYARAVLLFGAADPAESDAVFEFGKDGKPFFIAGPNDTFERCRQILGILNDNLGPGRFDYLMPIGGAESIRALPFEDEEDFEDEVDEDLGEGPWR